MSTHNHSMHGRLRLRFALLKKNPARLACVCDSLRGIHGIQTVEASLLTGTMVIHYDNESGNKPRFWDDVEAVLEYNHLHHDKHATTDRNPVHRLVQRSAQALAAALR